MRHTIRYLPVLAITGTSLWDAPSVLAKEVQNLSALLNAISTHKIFGRTTVHGVALDFEFPGFKK